MNDRALRVSVVVPTYKRPDLLLRCLKALLRQDLPSESYEVIVADDALEPGTRRTVDRLAAYSRVRLRYQPVTNNHGPAAARNAGWRSARSPVIAFTDDDCLPSSSWLREGLDAFRNGVGAAWGKLLMPAPPVPTDYERNASGITSSEFVTANCFCRRSVLETVNGFDERFTRAWREDSDLYFRLLRSGAHVAPVPRAMVVHPIRPAFWGVSVRQQKNNFFEALLYKKHRALYRSKLASKPPWLYYGIVVCAVAAMVGFLFGAVLVGGFFAVLWAAQTAFFLSHRLTGTSKRLSHVLEMVVTSIAIPPVAVYYRLKGAFWNRVFFL